MEQTGSCHINPTLRFYTDGIHSIINGIWILPIFEIWNGIIVGFSWGIKKKDVYALAIGGFPGYRMPRSFFIYIYPRVLSLNRS